MAVPSSTRPPVPTVRGTALLAVAGMLVATGLVLGRREALALAAFLLATVLASLLVLLVRRALVRRSTLERHVSQDAPFVGDAVQVGWDWPGRGPVLLDRLRDTVPTALPILPDAGGSAPSAALTTAAAVPVEPDGYRFLAGHRGAFALGPARALLRGPFGLWRAEAVVVGTAELTIRPRPLPSDALYRLLRAGSGERETADLLGRAAAPDDLLVREHRQGDPLNRVHWGATARTGRLMVRQEESAYDPVSVVVLDCRAVSYPAGRHTVEAGAGRRWQSAPGFELAVRTAVTVLDRLHDSGHRVILLDQDGAPLEDTLATVALQPTQREAGWPRSLPPRAATVVALLGEAAEQDVPVLQQVPREIRRIALVAGAPATPRGPDDGGAASGSAGRPAHRLVDRLDHAGWWAAGLESVTTASPAPSETGSTDGATASPGAAP